MASEEDDGPDGSMIVWPLERLARLMRAREHDGGLNPAQWEALRYLKRANRHSDSPGALSRYLGATKGTISQTVKALERKGYVSKSLRGSGGKSVRLTLTSEGLARLQNDPWSGLADAAGKLGGKTRRRMQRGLDELLAKELLGSGLESFGLCSTCRFFRENGRTDGLDGLHLCMLFEQAMTEEEAQKICVEHETAP